MTEEPRDIENLAFAKCRDALPGWRGLARADVTVERPKGFSSLTLTMRAPAGSMPAAVLYRHLDGKENAILDFARERDTFLLLGEHDVAARCYHYDDTCRIESFYDGRTLVAKDVFDPDIQRKIAAELFKLHRLAPADLPETTFFVLLHEHWGALARSVVEDQIDAFPPEERRMCDELRAIYNRETFEMVQRCLPARPPTFCHNDTYHGNIMKLAGGEIRLLDFEFSCRNFIAFDFANLFAETVMVHGLPSPPHFRIAEPKFGRRDIEQLIGFYLDHVDFWSDAERAVQLAMLADETESMVMLSDYMYAMAALPLAVKPIQRIRFIPYAWQRFARFREAWAARFG